MESSATGFNLESALNSWVKVNCSGDDVTPADVTEIKEQMIFTINELINEKDLTEEEAFAVAKVRFGGKDAWAEEMQTVNEKNFQLKKVIFLFGGVFAFVFGNYFVLCIDKITLIVLYKMGYSMDSILNIIRIFIRFIYFITILFFVATFYMHKPVLWLTRRINFNMIASIIFIFLVFGSVLAERYLGTKVTGILGNNIVGRGKFFYIEGYFKDLYLLLNGIGYLFLFFRYRKSMYI